MIGSTLNKKSLRSVGWGIPLVFLCCSQAIASPLDSKIRTLEHAVNQYVAGEPASPIAQKIRTDADLSLLRRHSISSSQWKTLNARYRNRGAGEVAFRLARHAYLLSQWNDVTRWLGAIKEGDPFKAEGLYLQGLLKLTQGKRGEASDAFAQAVEADPRDGQVSAEATMALARIAFDAGRYESSASLYTAIPAKMRAYESSLQELAWSHLKNERPDLAATDIHLLFALYPQSELLPQAGYLLGEIYEGRRSLPEGVKALDQLTQRFAFEEEASSRALKAFSGQEEELLAEFDPTLFQAPVRAMLPPIGQRLLKEHPTVREYLRRLREIREDQEELRNAQAIIEGSQLALETPGAATLDSVTLLEWCNDLERRLHGSPKIRSPLEATKLETLKKEILTLQSESDVLLKDALEVEAHISLAWDFLGGERDRLALETKREVRQLISTTTEKKATLIRLTSKLEALALRIRKEDATQVALLLDTLRMGDKHYEAIIRLDDLREKIQIAEKKHRNRFQRLLKQTMVARTKSIRDLDRRADRLLKEARGTLRKVFRSNQMELVRMLTEYRWSIAEARYKYLKATEKDFKEARKNAAQEALSLESRYGPIQIPPALSFLKLEASNPIASKRVAAAQKMEQVGIDFIHEIDSEIATRIQNDRKRYQEYQAFRVEQLTNEREIRREEAILAYQQFSHLTPTNDRTPYALYRLAQLHYERANSIARIMAEAAPQTKGSPDYSLSIVPLRRIQKEFRSFPHRDSALYLLAYSLLEAGQRKRSVSTFKQLVAEYPRSKLIPEVQLRIGEHYFGEKNYRRAIPHYSAVLTRGFNFFYDKALYKLAWSNYLVKKYDSAVAYFLILLDYREVLDPSLRERYIQFSEEASEYVAFSLFRSGGAPAARNLFREVGWKSYALPVLERMALIFVDRGRFRKALDVYALALTHYPNTSNVPSIYENRIKLFERSNQPTAAIEEKRRAVKTLALKGPWRQKNQSNRDAIATADRILDRATYSLATQYDALFSKTKSRKHQKEALLLYREVADQHPLSEEAYFAHFRLAQLSFLGGNSKKAIEDYDIVVRNSQYNEHFNESLYGIVAARERIIEDRGGVERLVTRSKEKVPTELVDLLRSIDNFATRAPKDDRVPETLYRSGFVASQAGEQTNARTRYLHVYREYPDNQWSQPALLAAVDSAVAEENWEEAATLASTALAGERTLQKEVQERLTILERGARFKLAASFDEKNESEKAIEAYFTFQTSFPKSDLAPKSLFNAFVIAKRTQRFDKGDEALRRLIEGYPKSAEAKLGHFERALLLDSVFHIDAAIAEYKTAIHSNLLPKETLQTAVANSVTLLAIAPKASLNRSTQILTETKRVDEPLRSELESFAAVSLEQEGKEEAALSIWKGIARRRGAPFLTRVKAATEVSQVYFQRKERRKALKWKSLTNEINRLVRKKDRPEAELAMARLKAAQIKSDRERLAKTRIVGTSLKKLQVTFKRKATRLAKLETSALNLIKIHSTRASASALYQLGLAYTDFSAELKELEPPTTSTKKEKEEFSKTIATLIEPLAEKSRQAFEKSYELLKPLRVKELFVPDLLTHLQKLDPTTPQLPAHSVPWVKQGIPSPPPFRSESLDIKNFWLPASRQEGVKTLQNALLADPNNVDALHDLAILQLYDRKLSDFKRSMQILQKKLPPDLLTELQSRYQALKGEAPQNRAWHVFYLIGKKKNEEALTAAKDLIRTASKSPVAMRALAAAYLANDNRRMARFVLARAHDLHTDDPLVANDLAQTLDGNRNLLYRSTLLKKGAESGHPEPAANWALLAYQIGALDTARAEWEVAFKASGEWHKEIQANVVKTTPKPTELLP